MNTIEIDYLLIVPCRKNSSRLKFKNRKKINNKTLYEITIEQGRKFINSRVHLVVNTDDEKIIKYCVNNKIDYFMRKKIHASNKSRVSDSIIDMINTKFSQRTYKIKNIILLQTTSPLRNISDIKKSINLYESNNYKSLCSLSESRINYHWLNKLNKSKSLNNFLPKKFLNINSQDLPKSYGVNGAIFISDLKGYLKYKRFFNRPKSIAYVMPEKRSIDIDNEFDYVICKSLMENAYYD